MNQGHSLCIGAEEGLLLAKNVTGRFEILLQRMDDISHRVEEIDPGGYLHPGPLMEINFLL